MNLFLWFLEYMFYFILKMFFKMKHIGKNTIQKKTLLREIKSDLNGQIYHGH